LPQKESAATWAAPFASNCVERAPSPAAVDLDPKKRHHPEPALEKERNVVILSRRFLPSEGSERAARRAAEAQ